MTKVILYNTHMFDIWDTIADIKKRFTKNDFLAAGMLLIGYIVMRTVNLTKFPIFSDEAIYIHWAKVAWHDATWRFISLTDGKQPLQTWGTIPFLKLFPTDALMAGRLFAAASGLFALVGLFLLIRYVFGKRAAFIGAFLYVITPYFLFYDRMALVDSAVNGFFIWIVLLSLVLFNTLRYDVALLFGLISGLGLLGKSSVRLFMLIGFGAVVTAKKWSFKRIANFAVLFGFGTLLALIVYNVQRLSPFFQFVSQKNNTFIVTLPELIESPFRYFTENIVNIPYYIFSEMAYVVPILGVLGIVHLLKKKNTYGLFLLCAILFPTILIAFISKVLFPRYIIFLGTLLLIPASYAIAQIKTTKKLVAFIVLIVLSVSYFNYSLLFNPAKTPFPGVDRGQYLEGWPAGWGAQEIVQYAREHDTGKRITFLAEGDFGMAGDVLDAFIYPTDNMGIKGEWPLGETQLFAAQALLEKEDVYVVFGHQSEFPEHWPIKLIKNFEKPHNKSAIYFFKLQP